MVLPHGRGHSLVDNPETVPTPLEEIKAARAGGGCPVLAHGGGGAATGLICGEFHFEHGKEHALLDLLPPLIHIKGENGRAVAWLESTLNFLACEVRSGRPGMAMVIDRLLDIVFVQVVQAWMEEQPEGTGGWLGSLRDDSVGAALGFIHGEPERAWTVAELGREVGMSRSAFAARFRNLVGSSPLQYLKRWRMELATQWMRDHSLSLAQVARQVGYQSEAAFSKAFKDYSGLPPATWRRRFV